MMKISVIIPIYNIQHFLRECVHSVISQSWKNIEIILVNDGSVDDSPVLCDELQKQDARITVIHKPNGGLSDARNAGIRMATGDYLLFLDGDDFWNDKNAVEKLVKRVSQTKADVLNFSYQKFYEDTNQIQPYFSGIDAMPLDCDSKEKQIDYLTKHHLYIASACNKLIRKELFDEDLMFTSGIYSEDIEWCARLLGKARSMDFICENFYCYRQRSDSITHTITIKKCNDLCNNILGCVAYAETLLEPFRTYLYRYTAYQFGTFFVVQAHSGQKPEEGIEKLKKYTWLLQYHAKNKKLLILYVGTKIIGFSGMCKLLRFVLHR